MSQDSLASLADALVDERAYLPSRDQETRLAIRSTLDLLATEDVDPHDCFGLALVMLGVRPACSLSTMQPALSLPAAETVARDHDALVTAGLLGQFLESYEIPYALRTGYHEGRADGPAQVFVNYYVSFDETRLNEFETRLGDVSTGEPVDRDRDLGPGLPRREEEALGWFLGYPEPAIRAYCDEDHRAEGGEQLLDRLNDAEIAAALGPTTELYDNLGLDYREFTRFALPYLVPASVPECLDRMATDATRYLVAGLVTTDRYEMDLFTTVLDDYYERFGERPAASPA